MTGCSEATSNTASSSIALRWRREPSRGRSGESREDGFDREEQDSTVRREFNEVRTGHIESPGILVLRLNQRCANADALRSRRYAAERVGQDVRAKAATGIGTVDGQPADDQHGYRRRGIAANLARRLRPI